MLTQNQLRRIIDFTITKQLNAATDDETREAIHDTRSMLLASLPQVTKSLNDRLPALAAEMGKHSRDYARHEIANGEEYRP